MNTSNTTPQEKENEFEDEAIKYANSICDILISKSRWGKIYNAYLAGRKASALYEKKIAGDAFEAGATYEHHYHMGLSTPEPPNKETYLNSLNSK
jgi:hypothetical protein